MILDVQGSAGTVEQSIPVVPIGPDTQIRLKYFHFPDLPLLDAFVDALTVNGQKFTIPAVSSIEQLVNELDSLVEGVTRVCYVWYNFSEFEICVGTQSITLSAAFAAVVKLPVALVANTCYSTSLYESTISLYSHFAVQVQNVRGHWSDNEYDTVIAKVRRDGDVSAAHTHYFRGDLVLLEMSVNVVKRDGTVAQYVSPEIWSLGLELIE